LEGPFYPYIKTEEKGPSNEHYPYTKTEEKGPSNEHYPYTKTKKKASLKQQFKTFQLSLSLQSTKSHLMKITGQKHKF
jgi:hypothetical protein